MISIVLSARRTCLSSSSSCPCFEDVGWKLGPAKVLYPQLNLILILRPLLREEHEAECPYTRKRRKKKIKRRRAKTDTRKERKEKRDRHRNEKARHVQKKRPARHVFRREARGFCVC